MRKLLLLLVPVMFVLGSCKKDNNSSTVTGEKEVEMQFVSPMTYAPGDETLEEKDIKTLDILVFDGSGNSATFLYRRAAWRISGAKFRSTMLAGDDLTVYFVANARQLLLDLTPSVLDEGTATWADVKAGLVMDEPDNIVAADGLPMWGLLHDVDIAEQPQHNLGTINLMRSIASADVYVTADPADFTLETGYLVFAADKGFLAFSESKLVTAGGKYEVSGPESPTGMVADQELTYTVPAGQSDISYVFYMYENDASLTPAAGANRQSRIILKGTYLGAGGKGVSTYYPLDFRDDTTDDRLQVTRNHKYVLVITKVNGDGFDSLDEAKDGHSENVEYNVIPWTGDDDTDIQIYGNKYISMGRKTAYLTRPAGSVDSIRFATNFDLSEIKMKFSTDAGAGVVDEIENTRFKVEIVTYNGVPYFKVTAKEAYNFDADNRQQVLANFGGRLEVTLEIIQTNEVPDGWNDGGDIEGEVGG